MNLPRLFAGIPYLVVGGVATRSYMPERFTKDIDILVPSHFAEEAASRLRDAEWKDAGALRFPDSSLGLSGTLWKLGNDQIDLVTSAGQWAIDASSSPGVDASGTRIISLPYLLLMKLDSGRAQDTAGSRMLALADEPTIERHEPSFAGTPAIAKPWKISRVSWKSAAGS